MDDEGGADRCSLNEALDSCLVIHRVRPLVERLEEQLLTRAKEPDDLTVELNGLSSDHPGTQSYVARFESIPPEPNAGLRRPPPASAPGITLALVWLPPRWSLHSAERGTLAAPPAQITSS